MPLDPQVKRMLEQTAALNLPPLNTLTAAEARAQFDKRRAATPPGPELARVEDLSLPGPAGEIAVRVFRPATVPLPGVVAFHGGGWVVGSVESHDALCRHVAKASGCTIISVEYRLAPEHTYPAAAEDCYAALRWVSENATSLGVQPGRIAVAGESAGGNLAAAVSLMARDRGGPPIAHQLLVYPVTDARFDTPSYIENSSDYMLTRDSMMWYWDCYVPNDADRLSAYAAPLQAKDLAGLPPAHVITAEYDPLRDEGEAYAEALRAAGVPVVCQRYDGMVHGFYGNPHLLDKAREAIADASEQLRQALGTPARS